MTKSGATVEQSIMQLQESYSSQCPRLKLKLSFQNVAVVVIAWMGKVQRPIPLQINVVTAVTVTEANQSLYQHGQIRLENKSLDFPAEKSKRTCSIDCVCIGCQSSYSIRQVCKVDDSKNVPRGEREDKNYVKERTKKNLKMQEKQLPHNTWSLGQKVLLYCIVQLLRNNNLDITTWIIHCLYTKLLESNGAGFNNWTKFVKAMYAKVTYTQKMKHRKWSQHFTK